MGQQIHTTVIEEIEALVLSIRSGRSFKMHVEAFAFVAQFSTTDPITVIEIGSRIINGTVRGLFPNAHWTGLDLTDPSSQTLKMAGPPPPYLATRVSTVFLYRIMKIGNST